MLLCAEDPTDCVAGVGGAAAAGNLLQPSLGPGQQGGVGGSPPPPSTGISFLFKSRL